EDRFHHRSLLGSGPEARGEGARHTCIRVPGEALEPLPESEVDRVLRRAGDKILRGTPGRAREAERVQRAPRYLAAQRPEGGEPAAYRRPSGGDGATGGRGAWPLPGGHAPGSKAIAQSGAIVRRGLRARIGGLRQREA